MASSYPSTPLHMAEEIARSQDCLIHFREQFYVLQGQYFKALSKSEVDILITNQIDKVSELRKKEERAILPGLLNREAIKHSLVSISHVGDRNEIDSFLDGESSERGRSKFVCADGILDIENFVKTGILEFKENDGNFLTFKAVPHRIDRENNPRLFLDFLESILPDASDQMLIQEVFGYCLLSDCRFQRAVIFVGDGANGKSVLLLILKLLLGQENVSAVSLDMIDLQRTFPMVSMIGKYANIVSDLNEVDRVAEGALKQIVSGEPITMERKHRDPFVGVITAKMIFSTNILPIFRDRSEAVYRRLLVIPFKRSFLKSEDQRKEFGDPDFWLKSGELGGILHWALLGLKRIIVNGKFTESDMIKQLMGEYRKDANPVRVFLGDHIEICAGAEVPHGALYGLYSQWCRENGSNPMSGSNFTKEVLRLFPEVYRTENARNWNGRRTRFFLNLKLIKTDL